MDRVAGPPRGETSLGADIETPFEDRTLQLEDGIWTPTTNEERVMREWTEQNMFMGVTFPVSCLQPVTDLKCSCGSHWRFKGQMEFLSEGRYEYNHDALCPECGTRAAITTEALIQ